METFATPYPLIFHDGERDHAKGQIGVHSVLSFKRFQAILSQKVGLPANQLSVVFVCKRTTKDADKRQHLPINDNTNFNIILNQHNPMREKDCHFLVFVKKSKKERKGTRRKNVDIEIGEGESISPRSDRSPHKEALPSKAEDVTESNEVAPEMQACAESILPDVFNGTISRDVDSISRREPQELMSSPPRGRSTPEKVLLRRDQKALGCLDPDSESRDSVLLDTMSMDGKIMRDTAADKQHNNIKSERSEGQGSERPSNQPWKSPQSRFPTTERLVKRFPTDTPVPNAPTLLPRTGTLNPLLGTDVPVHDGYAPRLVLRSPTQSPAGITFLSRDLNGVPFRTSEAFQQVQARYLHLQYGHGHLDSEAVSNIRGVVRDFAAYGESIYRPSGFCQHCHAFRERNINPTPFHLCVHDRVTNGFRGPSPAGPIERPNKRVEAAA